MAPRQKAGGSTGSRCGNYSRQKFGLERGDRPSLEAVVVGAALWRLGHGGGFDSDIALTQIFVSTQGIAKRQIGRPALADMDNYMDEMGAFREIAAPSEDMVAFYARMRRIVVSEGNERTMAALPVLQPAHTHENVEDRLGAEPRHGGRAIVLYRNGKTSQRAVEAFVLGRKSIGPARVIWHHNIAIMGQTEHGTLPSERHLQMDNVMPAVEL